MKWIFSSFLFLFNFNFVIVCAQSERSMHAAVSLGPSFLMSTFKDPGVSLLPFTGHGLGTSISGKTEIGVAGHELYASYGIADLSNSKVSAIILREKRLSVEYVFTRLVFPSTSLRLRGRAGGSLNLLSATRNYNGLQNSSPHRDLAASIGGVAGLTLYFPSIMNGLQISELLNVPVITALNNRSYNDNFPGRENLALKGIGSFFRFVNTVKTTLAISRLSGVSLAYRIDYLVRKDHLTNRQLVYFTDLSYRRIL